MTLEVFDIVRIKEDDYGQIENVTSTHGKIAYNVSGDHQELFEDDLILVCKCDDRKDNWVNA